MMGCWAAGGVQSHLLWGTSGIKHMRASLGIRLASRGQGHLLGVELGEEDSNWVSQLTRAEFLGPPGRGSTPPSGLLQEPTVKKA